MSDSGHTANRPGAEGQGKLHARLTGLLRNPSIRGIAGVLMLKATMVLFNFALVALAANVLKTVEFGIYSIVFSAVGLLGIVATVGQQVLLMRSWNEYSAAQDPAMLKGALKFSLTLCAAGILTMACGFYFWAEISYGAIFARAVTIYLVLYAAIQTTSHLLRASTGVGAGDGFGNLLPVFPAICYLGYELAAQSSSDAATIFYLLAFGSALGLALHIAIFIWRLRSKFPGIAQVRSSSDQRQWLARSMRLWMSTGLEAANQYLDVLIIGALMSPAIAGGYFVTTRFANVFSAAADSIHLFASRHVPDLFYRREYDRLNNLLDIVAGITLAMILAGIVGIIAVGHPLLALINPEFAQYYPALVVLCLGTAATAAAGPCASILMLTGHEGRYLTIIAGSVALRATGFFLLIPAFGILGAVSASALSFVLMALLLSHSARKMAGFDGSVMRLLHRHRAEVTPLAAE